MRPAATAQETHAWLPAVPRPPLNPAADTGLDQVHVHSHFLFKLLYEASSGKVWAHWQSNCADAKVTRPISYEELVKRVEVDLLPSLPTRSVC